MFATALPSALAASEAMRRMLAAEDLTVRPALAITALAAVINGGQRDAGQHANTAELASRLAGRTLQATVLQKLSDGTATVQIDGETLQVAARLPDAARSVLLRFPAMPPSGTPGAPAQALVARTPAGVIVGALAHALSDASMAPTTPLPLGPIDADPAHPREFAAALASLVRDSGMFYEAHLARWSQGQYPLDLLRREPQAAAVPVPEPGKAGFDPGQAAPPSASTAQATAISVAVANAALPEALQPVLREQLQVLENRCLAVAIEPWPGQAARLEIGEEPADDQARQGARPTPGWVSRLSLDLPDLGRLDAQLSLDGKRLSLVLHVDRDAATRVTRGAAALAHALSVAGITLAGCRIVEHAQD
jgi:hypothetical protein